MKPSCGWIAARGQYPKKYGGKIFLKKKKPTECPRFGCCPWTMTSRELGDCPVEVLTLLRHGVSPWGVCISSVDIRSHTVANYQGKKGSRCVEITGFQVGGSSVRGARRFSSTRTLQCLSKFETMTCPCQNPQRP